LYPFVIPTNGFHLRHGIHKFTPVHVERDHVVRGTFLKHLEVDHHLEAVIRKFLRMNS